MSTAPAGAALWQFDAGQLDRAFASRAVSPVEVLNACLERAAAINPRLNALILIDEPGATAAARASEERMRAGTRLGPLDGVPFTVKDNLFVAGLAATWGSRLFEHFIAPVDDLPVAKLRAVGAVMVGKTNTPELSLASFTDNLLFGPTRNPWDTALSPGGSSGGAVASVAAGITPFAVGTDAGGSTRVPSGYTGLYGLRPSTGAIARLEGFPALGHDFQAIGLMARSVADVATVFAQLAGPDPRDALSLRYPHARNAMLAPQVRIRLCDRIGEEPVEPEARATARLAADRFAALGCRVQEGPPPYDLETVKALWGTIPPVGAARVVTTHPDWQSRVGDNIRALATSGLTKTAVKYLQALDRVVEFRRDVARRWQGFDVLLTPTSAALPWRAEEPFPKTIAGVPANARSASIFATWVNAAGFPGLNIPVTRSTAGLPIGAQLVGTFGADEGLLALAQRYAAAHGGLGWPPM